MGDDSGWKISTIFFIIFSLALVGGLVALGIYFAAKNRKCKEDKDCLQVLGYTKCFLKAGEAEGKCNQCGKDADCSDNADAPFCVEGVCVKEKAPVATPLTECDGNDDTRCLAAGLVGKTRCVDSKCLACKPATFSKDCSSDDTMCTNNACVPTCTTDAECAAGNPNKPFCQSGKCSNTCTLDSQCGSGMKCSGGECKIPCTGANMATVCVGETKYCGNGFCTSTDCTNDAQCIAKGDPLKTSCIKPAGSVATDRGNCGPTSCTTNLNCDKMFDNSGMNMGRRCNSDKICAACSATNECGTNFNCIDGKCRFNPSNWRFYPTVDVKTTAGFTWVKAPATTDRVQGGLYNVSEILQASSGGLLALRVYEYSDVTGKAKVDFYTSPTANTYKFTAVVTPYNYSSTTITNPNGVYLYNTVPI
jgi:hypothetical protein